MGMTSSQEPRTPRASRGILSEVATFLGVFGLVVLLSSSTLGLYSFGAESWLTLGPIFFSLLCLVLWLLLSFRRLTERLSQRAAQYFGLSVGYATLLVTTIALTHYGLSRVVLAYDVSAQRIHSLSEQSEKLLDQLPTPVRITVFLERGDELRNLVERFEQTYRKASPKVSFRYLSPTIDVEAVRKYRITPEGPQVIAETFWDDGARRQEGRTRLAMTELNHEEKISQTIRMAAISGKQRVYILGDHGEADPQSKEPNGFHEGVIDLGNEGYQVVPLHLALTKSVPDDASVVLLLGPQNPLLPPEVEALATYLAGGGRLGVFLEPQTISGVEGLLGKYGVQANDDVIIDITPFGQVYGKTTAIASDYSDHPIVAKFQNAMTVFPMARSLSVNPGPPVRNFPLARTGERTWGETDFSGLAENRAEWDAGEVRGPIVVALAVESEVDDDKGQDAPAQVEAPVARLVVIGDASFATNEHRMVGANRNLLLNIVGYLAADESRIAIRPRSRGANLIVLTPGQREGIAFFSIYLLPVSLLSIGLGIWLVRRQR
jgi:ABC-type uncharacterized transport system involved in gliding motility auxiliary subunit